MDERLVVQVGLVGSDPGGMAQVVNEQLSWEIPGYKQAAMASITRARDPLSPARALAVAIRLLALRMVRPVPIIVVHLSERGSFVREGLLLGLANRLGMPTVAYLHGADFAAFAQRRPKLVARVLNHAHHVILLTQETADIVAACVDDKVVVSMLPNAVKVPEASVSKKNAVLFCGEVSHRKGIDVLLAAWSEGLANNNEWELVVAGPMARGLVASELPAHDNVRFVGAVSRSQALKLQDEAAIAVLPSRAEALPMFLVEAMARKCAVVSTPVGQISELLADGAGLLVAPDDVTALAQAIGDLVRDPDLRQEYAEAGYERVVAAYSSEIVSERLRSVWDSFGEAR